MQIVFDPDFDHGSWPGPLASQDAALGVAWLGPQGLLAELELRLGLGGRWPSELQRTAALAAELQTVEGFWQQSAQVDVLGSARELLRWRDELVLAGWEGQGDGRLAALAAVTDDLPPGLPDRWRAVRETLGRRSAGIDELAWYDEGQPLDGLFAEVFAALEHQGTRLTSRTMPHSAGNSDLRGCFGQPFRPMGDGSLQLLRPFGALAAADEVAAWLAEHCPRNFVVVTPAPVLDAALARHGLPTTGAAGSGHPLLAVLPLVLEMAWLPADPEAALKLLLLPFSPVPGELRWRLAEALHERPAVGSREWHTALAAGLAKLPEERRDGVAKRIAAIFTPAAARPSLPVSELKERCQLLRRWAIPRKGDAPWDALLEQITELEAVLGALGWREVTGAQLQRLLVEVTTAASRSEVFAAEAGAASVGAPGCVVGPAPVVVWWQFARGTATLPAALPLGETERADLVSAGVRLPDPAAVALSSARRWRRPLHMATGTCLLICPERTESGDGQSPHPLFDEFDAATGDRAQIDTLVVRELMNGPAKTPSAAVAVPAYQADWAAPPPAVSKLSVTGAGRLIACPFRWLTNDGAHLRRGVVKALPSGGLLVGNLAHWLLEELLAGAARTPDDAKAAAEALFEERGPQLAAALWLPGAAAQRAEAKRRLGQATKVLYQFFADERLTVAATERKLEGVAAGVPLEGRADLVLGPRPMVVDLKNKGSRFDQLLAEGGAYQLAAYSRMLAGEGEWPPVAYFVLDRQRLYSEDAQPVPDATPGARPGIRAVWDGFVAALEHRLRQLAEGTAPAMWDPDLKTEVSDRLRDGVLWVKPCEWCEQQGLCGRLYNERGAQ